MTTPNTAEPTCMGCGQLASETLYACPDCSPPTEAPAPAAPSAREQAVAARKKEAKRHKNVMPYELEAYEAGVYDTLTAAARVPGGAAGTLFEQGEFTLSSGQASTWKIECDVLTPADWAGLARIAMERWDLQFSAVVGVPSGGIPFADALREFEDSWGPTLVVDDVLTTGKSMRVEMAKYADSTGLVAFARGSLPPNVKAVWLANAPYGGAADEALEALLRDAEGMIFRVTWERKDVDEELLEESMALRTRINQALAVARAPGPVGGEQPIAESEEAF